MAFVTQGVKATWANPGANDPAPANRQAGGWYFNPQTGSVDQWFPDTAGSAGGAGAPAQTAGSLPSTNANDYFSKAMDLLKPSIEAQVAPLKEQQTLIPKLFESAKQDIGSQQMAQLGQQRASNAAAGFASTSGVEQSQEANIAQGWAKQLATLPVQEAQALTTLASQIAQIQGGGVKDAMNYAGDLAKMASDQIWKQADYKLRADTLDETKRYHDLYLASRRSGAGTLAGQKQATIDALKQDIVQGMKEGQPNLFPRIMALYSGELTPDEIGLVYNSISTAIPAGSPQAAYAGGYKETPEELGLEAGVLKSTQAKGAAQGSVTELTQRIQSGEITSLQQARAEYPKLAIPDTRGNSAVDTAWNNRKTSGGGGGIAGVGGSAIDFLKSLLQVK